VDEVGRYRQETQAALGGAYEDDLPKAPGKLIRLCSTTGSFATKLSNEMSVLDGPKACAAHDACKDTAARPETVEGCVGTREAH
jgi:hypothetical protein